MRISDWSSDVCSSDLTREAARAELIDTWDAQRLADPEKTRIILTHTNAEVRDLNQAARDRLREAGELGRDVRIWAERGAGGWPTADRTRSLQNNPGRAARKGRRGKAGRGPTHTTRVGPQYCDTGTV